MCMYMYLTILACMSTYPGYKFHIIRLYGSYIDPLQCGTCTWAPTWDWMPTREWTLAQDTMIDEHTLYQYYMQI